MSHLLPYNATQLERAISETSAESLAAIKVPIGDLHDPMKCPSQLLPWLAWQWSVDDWDDEWTEEQKRNYLAIALDLQAYKGTPWAVERAIQTLDYVIHLQEWFEYGGQPKRFRVDIETNNEGIIDEIWDKLYRTILYYKNARSHLERLRIIRSTAGNLRIASACLMAETITVYPYQGGSVDLDSPVIHIASGVQSIEWMTVYPN